LRKVPSSRKGKMLIPAELQAKQKCAIIDEAKRQGFRPDSVERTLNPQLAEE
jgi:hypothetical protein